MFFRQLIDRESSTYTYLLADEDTREAVLIDPVREQTERDIGLLEDLGFTLRYVLETHVHADHITSAGVLRQRLGAKTVLSAAAGAGCPDVLVEDGDKIRLGGIEIEARHTPGHTSGCVTYVVDDGETKRAFTGDTLMIRGCGRTDFQQGDAGTLYDSVWNKIFTLPDATPVHPGHDYRGQTATTVGEEKRLNPRLGGGRDKAEFQRIMAGLKLSMPKKIEIAVPANMHCGILHDDSWAPVRRTDDDVPEVDVDWVRAHLDDVTLVDVRRADELVGELGAIERALHVPMDRVSQAMGAWDKDDPIVIVCRSGGRSGAVARLLQEAGFVHIASMRGGMLAWRATSKVAGLDASACG